MNKPEGIIFDCDGCLLDSEVVFLKTVVKYLKKYEIDTSLEELIFVIGKPNPDIYYLAQSKLGIPKERLVVIEDSYNGIQAGKSAGIYTIAYKGSMIEQDTSNADCAVYSYEQIEW